MTCCPKGSIGMRQGLSAAAAAATAAGGGGGTMVRTVDRLLVPAPRGRYVNIDGVVAYESGDGATAKGAVVVIPEVWGIASGRLKTIADELGDRGFLSILPKLQPSPHAKPGDGWEDDGYGRDRDDGLGPWIGTLTWEVTRPKMEKVMRYCSRNGTFPVGAIGFCWGSWVIYRMAAEPRAMGLSCGVSCHPSVLIEQLVFKRPLEALVEKAGCPMLMLPAGNDDARVKKGGVIDKVLATKPFYSDCDFVEFPQREHGWVARGDGSNDDAMRADIDRALSLSYAYLQRLVLDKKSPSKL